MKSPLILIIILSSIFANFLNAQIPAEIITNIQKHVNFLSADSLDGRGLSTQGHSMAGIYISKSFEEIGLKKYDNDYIQEFNLRIQLVSLTGKNIVGIIEGSDPLLKHEYIVIGAHYDHLGYEVNNNGKVVYNGADDNASGVAGIIEIARILILKREVLKRSVVIIAFDAEESGLKGAEAFVAQKSLIPATSVKAMFSLDMIGMYDAYGGMDLKGIGSIKGGSEVAKNLAKSMNITLKDISADIEARTDTWPFGQQGIPSIHAFTGLKSPYHKPEDDADKLQYDGMSKVVGYLSSLILELANIDELQPIKGNATLGMKNKFNLKVGLTSYIGNSFHQYPDKFYRAKSRIAASTGPFLLVDVGRNISFKLEGLYDYNGSYINCISCSNGQKATMYRHSFLIPFSFQYAIFNINGIAKAYPIGGAYYRYSISGETDGSSLAYDNFFKREEWGYLWGFGMDIMKFQISGKNIFGITSLTNADNTKFRSHMFCIGYTF